MILVYSSNKAKRIKRKVFTDCKITRLRRELGLNQKIEHKMFLIRTEMRFLTLQNKL